MSASGRTHFCRIPSLGFHTGQTEKKNHWQKSSRVKNTHIRNAREIPKWIKVHGVDKHLLDIPDPGKPMYFLCFRPFIGVKNETPSYFWGPSEAATAAAAGAGPATGGAFAPQLRRLEQQIEATKWGGFVSVLVWSCQAVDTPVYKESCLFVRGVLK